MNTLTDRLQQISIELRQIRSEIELLNEESTDHFVTIDARLRERINIVLNTIVTEIDQSNNHS